MTLQEFTKSLADIWPVIAAVGTLAAGWVIFKLKGIFATTNALDRERERIAALEKAREAMQTLLADALRDFDRRTDALAGKGELAGAEQSALRAHHRLDLLEAKMAALPDAEDYATLKAGIANLDAHGRELMARVETAVVGVRRIEEHLLRASA